MFKCLSMYYTAFWLKEQATLQFVVFLQRWPTLHNFTINLLTRWARACIIHTYTKKEHSLCLQTALLTLKL